MTYEWLLMNSPIHYYFQIWSHVIMETMVTNSIFMYMEATTTKNCKQMYLQMDTLFKLKSHASSAWFHRGLTLLQRGSMFGYSIQTHIFHPQKYLEPLSLLLYLIHSLSYYKLQICVRSKEFCEDVNLSTPKLCCILVMYNPQSISEINGVGGNKNFKESEYSATFLVSFSITSTISNRWFVAVIYALRFVEVGP